MSNRKLFVVYAVIAAIILGGVASILIGINRSAAVEKNTSEVTRITTARIYGRTSVVTEVEHNGVRCFVVKVADGGGIDCDWGE